MNWTMLGAIGQLAAVCVGIPSIVYLAVQVRRQTKERKQAAVHALTEQWGDLTSSLHDSGELADIFLRGLGSFGDLTPTDKLRFSTLFNRFMNVFEGMYFSHREGILIESSWLAVERMLEDFITNPGPQEWWVTRKRWHPSEFVQMVDEVIARAGQSSAFVHYDFGRCGAPPSS